MYKLLLVILMGAVIVGPVAASLVGLVDPAWLKGYYHGFGLCCVLLHAIRHCR